MFKKKKDVKKQESTTKIFSRLNNMMNKVSELKDEPFIIYNFNTLFYQLYSIEINTKLGIKRFSLSYSLHEPTQYGSSYFPKVIDKYELSMYEEDNETLIFHIISYKDSTKIKPTMKKDGLNANKIDLAIYELEQFLESEHDTYCNFHKKEIKKLEV